MSANKKFTLQPGVIEEADAAIRMAETGDKNPIAVPTSGSSGVSVGPRQMDLGQNPALLDNLLRNAREKGGLTVKDASEIRPLLSEQYGDRLKPGHKDYGPKLLQKSKEALMWAGELMKQPGADKILRDAEIKHLQANAKGVEALCKDAPDAAKDFCNSRQGQIEMLGMRHQYGNQADKAIKSVFTGEKVTIDIQGRKSTVQLEGKMDVEQFRKLIRDNTFYGAKPDPERRRGIEGRDQKMDKFYRDNGIDDGSKAKLNPPPKTDEPKPGAPETKPDAAKPDKHSVLPDDQTDAPVQSTEATPAREDENRFIVGWTTQPDMTSRPVWRNEAQYEAFKAQQAEAEAGAQAANAPEPAMPQSASLLQQPAPEQNTNLLEIASLMPDERSSRGPKVWSPDSGALADAVMQAGGTGLPIWTQMLLGRDAMTNGSRAAVKGLQNAINAATKPPGFDYHWGLGGREGRIDVDGDLGPQTMAGFGRAVDKHGDKGFARIYALDQFGRYTKGLDTGMSRIGDLEDALASTLGQVTPDAGARAQETLNLARNMIGDRQRYAPLKVDGWVGPVTSDAFKRAYDTFGSTRLFERFAGSDFWDEGV
jgi:hypothetical protein